MRLNIKYLYFLFVSLAFFEVPAQSLDDKKKIADLLYKSRKFYDNIPHYKASGSYKLFASYSSSHVVEQYDSFVIKNGNNSYSMIGSTEFVEIDGTSLKIDRESKLISMGQGERGQVPGSLAAIEKFMGYFNRFDVTAKDNFWICIMTTPEVAFIPYAKVVIYFNQSDFSVERQHFYLLQENEYKDGRGIKKTDFPRLEITTRGLDKQALDSKSKSKFTLSNYIRKKGSKSQPSKNYKGFKIVD